MVKKLRHSMQGPGIEHWVQVQPLATCHITKQKDTCQYECAILKPSSLLLNSSSLAYSLLDSVYLAPQSRQEKGAYSGYDTSTPVRTSHMTTPKEYTSLLR
jgi:hypothetical protein